LSLKRLAEFLRPVVDDEPGSIEANLDLHSGTFLASIVAVGKRPFPNASIDPNGFDWTPRDRAVACFALAIDPDPKSWSELFGLADRLEKVDRARAGVASISVRLDLLARLAGVRLETDLLRHLQAVSGWLGTDEKVINGGFLVLQLDQQDAAERIVSQIKPLPGSGPPPAGELARPRWLGKIEGQPLRITRSDRNIFVTWGEGVLEASMAARDHPERSAGPMIRELLPAGNRTLAAGVFWPERIPEVGPNGSPLLKNLDKASPIVWRVDTHRDQSIGLMVVWPGIKETVKRFLDAIPLDPPPDH
jgi:hypothetical protein